MKVLVLGHNGMLGRTVCDYLNKERDINVVIDSQKNRWPSDSFKRSIKNFNGDYIESQAFAFLAIRSFLNLPISFRTTTGCRDSTVGGKLVENF